MAGCSKLGHTNLGYKSLLSVNNITSHSIMNPKSAIECYKNIARLRGKNNKYYHLTRYPIEKYVGWTDMSSYFIIYIKGVI